MKVTIDKHEIDVPAGTTILNAARMLHQRDGIQPPPAMCYYSTLKGSGGKCRVCLVKVTQGSEKDPRPMPKLVPSCCTTVQEGMVVENNVNEDAVAARNSIVEMLLINHPLDCPICDQAGECHLQDLSYEHGKEATRYEFDRRTFEKIDIGPYIQLHMTRCILCYRCTYVADQLTNERVHGVMWRGDKSEISTYIQKAVENDFSGNMIDVCPVGALTDKKFRFKQRVWYADPFDAHRNCTKCSGKVVLWTRGNEVLRITGRKDEFGEVHDYICNECRFEHYKKEDWTIEGQRVLSKASVIDQNHYLDDKKDIGKITSFLDKDSWEELEYS